MARPPGAHLLPHLQGSSPDLPWISGKSEESCDGVLQVLFLGLHGKISLVALLFFSPFNLLWGKKIDLQKVKFKRSGSINQLDR